ncbi:Ogr/Delta-like zinc finger [compost metagenome]
MTEPLDQRQPTTRIFKRRCPDCGASLVKRSSESKHLLMSTTYLVCSNAVCGATFTGVDEITHRLSPPSRPNPAITLPFAPSALRRGVLEQQGLPSEMENQAPEFKGLPRPQGVGL